MTALPIYGLLMPTDVVLYVTLDVTLLTIVDYEKGSLL